MFVLSTLFKCQRDEEKPSRETEKVARDIDAKCKKFFEEKRVLGCVQCCCKAM